MSISFKTIEGRIVLSKDAASRLGKLTERASYFPPWNAEKNFVWFENHGWAKSDLFQMPAKGTSVSFRRGFLLTELGAQLLAEHNAAQPSASEKTQ